MMNREGYIIYLYYYIEKKIISKEEITECCDKRISRKQTLPYYFIELSLAKSLDEQYFILNDIIHREKINFRKLSPKYILIQVFKLYKLERKDCTEIIYIIFHMKDNINLDIHLLNDIYKIDNDGDLFLQKIISLKELKSRLDSFFQKYI